MTERIMIDLETLGNKPGAVILSIGASLCSDPGKTFYAEISPESAVEVGLVMDVDTVMWWMAQDTDARNFTKGSPIKTVLEDFAQWLGYSEGAEIWGNGSDFDNAILAEAYRRCGMPVPWKFWKNRCYRTLKNMFPHIEAGTFAGTKHNALCDAMHQARHLSRIIAHLNEQCSKEG